MDGQNGHLGDKIGGLKSLLILVSIFLCFLLIGRATVLSTTKKKVPIREQLVGIWKLQDVFGGIAGMSIMPRDDIRLVFEKEHLKVIKNGEIIEVLKYPKYSIEYWEIVFSGGIPGIPGMRKYIYSDPNKT